MKKFLIGLAVGAVAVYAASKLIDEETKEKFCDNLDRMGEKCKLGKRKALRARIMAKRGILSGRDKAFRTAGDLLDKASDGLHDLEDRFKEQTR